jgi:transposase
MAQEVAILGIDLGKSSCSAVDLDAGSAVTKRRRMRPENLATFTKSLPVCCATAQCLGWKGALLL